MGTQPKGSLRYIKTSFITGPKVDQVITHVLHCFIRFVRALIISGGQDRATTPCHIRILAAAVDLYFLCPHRSAARLI